MALSARRNRFRPLAGLIWIWSSVALAADPQAATEPTRLHVVQHRTPQGERSTSGQLLVQAADGGLLIEARDHQLVTVKAADLIANEPSPDPFSYLSADELAAQLQAELGADFTIVRTKRYIVATNAGEAYGRWCGRFLERLQVAFIAHWKRAGLLLTEPTHPLPVVIFADPRQFAAYATADAGDAVAGSQGYYSIRSNRIILTDLTNGPGNGPIRTDAEILRRIESRVANFTTVIHEATHQIAYNCGLHRRYADNPMWLVEGMAMYCEAPDLKSTSGWKSIGRIHPGRISQFRDYDRQRRGPESLKSLIVSDDRFRDPDTAVDAYSESWMLTYFLLQQHRAGYVRYLELLQSKPLLKWDTPDQREQQVLDALETDWESLETNFRRFANRLIAR